MALIQGGVGTSGGTWADLGAGGGVFTRALSALLGTTGTVVAVDRDVQAVRRLAELVGTGRIKVSRNDFTRPLDLAELDGLLLANSLHFVARQERVLRQLVAYLRPQGRLLVVEYDTRQRAPWGPFPVPLERLRELAGTTGLSKPQEVGRQPSRFGGRELYAAVAVKL